MVSFHEPSPTDAKTHQVHLGVSALLHIYLYQNLTAATIQRLGRFRPVMYTSISADVIEDKEKLAGEAKAKFGDGFDAKNVDVDEGWTYYNARLLEGHSKERLVVFRARPPATTFGCVRVYNKQDGKKLWDIDNRKGLYIGPIPAECRFELMVIEVKFITQK